MYNLLFVMGAEGRELLAFFEVYIKQICFQTYLQNS